MAEETKSRIRFKLTQKPKTFNKERVLAKCSSTFCRKIIDKMSEYEDVAKALIETSQKDVTSLFNILEIWRILVGRRSRLIGFVEALKMVAHQLGDTNLLRVIDSAEEMLHDNDLKSLIFDTRAFLSDHLVYHRGNSLKISAQPQIIPSELSRANEAFFYD